MGLYRGLSVLLVGVFLLVFGMSQVAAAPVETSTAPPEGGVILVLDASGSMWGEVDGRSKIAIAREVIDDLLADWEPSLKLGLIAYGHRRKGDCTDIETLVPVSTPDPAAISAKVHALQPKGMTPLSAAVQKAAAELRFTEQRAAVILISDGEETCSADPCQVGADLAMTGLDFTAHVIGFDVASAKQAGLRCLAEKTGGLFLTAGDAAGLKEALTMAVEEAKAPAPPIMEDPGQAQLQAPAEVPAGSPFEVIWKGPDSRNDYLTIVPAEADDGAYGDYVFTRGNSPATLKAPAATGKHEVRYIFGHDRRVLGRAQVIVVEARARLMAPEAVAAGSEFQIEWAGPDNPHDYLTVVAPDAKEGSFLSYVGTNKGNPAKLQAPEKPGNYEIRYVLFKGRETLIKRAITVTEVTATVETESPVKSGMAFEVVWTGPNNKNDYITIAEKGAPDGAYLSYAMTKKGSPAKLAAPKKTGSFEVRYVLGQGRRVIARMPVTVK
jgi:Ca-activated chloride channel family protein